MPEQTESVSDWIKFHGKSWNFGADPTLCGYLISIPIAYYLLEMC